MEKNQKLKEFIQEEVVKLHKITLLEEQKMQIEDELRLLSETKDVDAMYRKAGMKPPHPGKGIHTKKFHKCVTSVGDEGGKNPYAICMDKLGRNKAVKASHRTDEQINEEKGENTELEQPAIDFITNVLKMGTKENIFDVYMRENNISPELLSDFIDTVIKKIDKDWLKNPW